MKLIILDRDGVINFDSDQFIKSPEEWKPIPGSLEAIARLKAARPTLRVDDGATPDSSALEAETTIELTKAPANVAATPLTAAAPASPSLVPINMKCPVTGSPVNPKYTIVHEGRVIGFCCPNCPKEFWADPAKFADRLN